jgi:hypothetical protein
MIKENSKTYYDLSPSPPIVLNFDQKTYNPIFEGSNTTQYVHLTIPPEKLSILFLKLIVEKTTDRDIAACGLGLLCSVSA